MEKNEEKLEKRAIKLYFLTAGVFDNTDMKSTFGHDDYLKVWRELPQWKRWDYRTAVEEFIEYIKEN